MKKISFLIFRLLYFLSLCYLVSTNTGHISHFDVEKRRNWRHFFISEIFKLLIASTRVFCEKNRLFFIFLCISSALFLQCITNSALWQFSVTSMGEQTNMFSYLNL